MGEKEVQTGRLYIEGEPWDGKIEKIDLSTATLITEGSPCMCLPIRRDREQARIDARMSSLFFTLPPMELVATTTAEAAETFRELAQSMNQFNEMLHETIEAAIDMSKLENPKWWHYFRYSKKLRIRRKYQKLIMQDTGLAALLL